MKIITLTKGYEVKVDDEDYDKLMRYKWYASISSKKLVYAKRTLNYVKDDGKKSAESIYMHKEIMGLGRRKEKRIVDFKNLDTLDCQKENLRIATKSEDNANRKFQKNNKLGIKGVHRCIHSKDCARYLAIVKKDGIVYDLGCFASIEEAKEARDKKAKELYGDFFRP